MGDTMRDNNIVIAPLPTNTPPCILTANADDAGLAVTATVLGGPLNILSAALACKRALETALYRPLPFGRTRTITVRLEITEGGN